MIVLALPGDGPWMNVGAIVERHGPYGYVLIAGRDGALSSNRETLGAEMPSVAQVIWWVLDEGREPPAVGLLSAPAPGWRFFGPPRSAEEKRVYNSSRPGCYETHVQRARIPALYEVCGAMPPGDERPCNGACRDFVVDPERGSSPDRLSGRAPWEALWDEEHAGQVGFWPPFISNLRPPVTAAHLRHRIARASAREKEREQDDETRQATRP